MDIREFDIISYFEDRSISFHTSGKNVTAGWVNISCPFCGDDPSWHCGINLESKLFHCWRCGNKGSSLKIVQELEECSREKAEIIIDSFKEGFLTDPYSDINFEKSIVKRPLIEFKQGVLPKEASIVFPKMHLDYLRGRNFDPYHIIRKYKIQVCRNLGKYKFRIIAPVFIQKQIVGFVGADITRKAKLKYKNSSNNLKSVFYNIDNVLSDTVVITEGILDVWRLGDNSIASLGNIITDSQVNFLLQNKIKNVFIFPDSDAIEFGRKKAEQISGLFDHVEWIEIENGDPADLSDQEAKNLMKDIMPGITRN